LATILIVDPDRSAGTVLSALLKAAGYTTRVAHRFESARRLLAPTRPDLIITTVRLGRFNGLQLVIQGRANNPRLGAIAVDAKRDPVLERDAKHHGVTAYMVKPVRRRELLSLVTEALTRRERAPRKRASSSPLTRASKLRLVRPPIKATASQSSLRSRPKRSAIR
jgi:DNA-binding NtrC family response regulator